MHQNQQICEQKTKYYFLPLLVHLYFLMGMHFSVRYNLFISDTKFHSKSGSIVAVVLIDIPYVLFWQKSCDSSNFYRSRLITIKMIFFSYVIFFSSNSDIINSFISLYKYVYIVNCYVNCFLFICRYCTCDFVISFFY